MKIRQYFIHISLSVPLIVLLCHWWAFEQSSTLQLAVFVLYMSLYTASCVLCCGVCWLLCTVCGSFHKFLWPLWCYSQALCFVRRLHHNTCIPLPALWGLGGLGGRELQPGPCYVFLWPFYVYDSDVVWKENGREKGVLGLTTEESNHYLFLLFLLAQSGVAVWIAMSVCEIMVWKSVNDDEFLSVCVSHSHLRSHS